MQLNWQKVNKITSLYLEALSKGDYNNLIHLFRDDATILSPLYGRCKAQDFYKTLLSDTQQSVLTPLALFLNDKRNAAALHFTYRWTLANGRITTFDCVDIFEFDENHKISLLKIIYDTASARQLFDELER